ncbi:hypothetical protein ACWDUN_07065 [Mycobacterium sp. NPDC003323]
MRVRVRPYLMAGIAVVAAGSIALPQSVTPPGTPTVRQDTVALTAQTKSFDLLPAALVATRPPTPGTGPTELPKLLAEALEAAPAVTPSASAPQASALALPVLGNAIIEAYDVIMPWVDWGVNLGIYATEWIPVVNWFTPQISIFYYSLIRPVITSAVFNIAYWVGGAISFGQGLSNFFNDTVAAGVNFVNAEIDWFLSFLPPLPPFFPLSAASEAVMAVQGARTAVQIPAAAEAPAAETEESVETPGESIGEPGQTDGELAPTPTEPVEAEPEPEPAAEAPQVPAETDPEPEAPGDTVDPEETEPEAEDPKNLEESENSEGSEDSIEDSKDDEDAADEGAENPAPTKPDTTKPDTTKPDTTKPDTTDTDSADDTAPEKPSDTADKTEKAAKTADKPGSDS